MLQRGLPALMQASRKALWCPMSSQQASGNSLAAARMSGFALSALNHSSHQVSFSLPLHRTKSVPWFAEEAEGGLTGWKLSSEYANYLHQATDLYT